MEQAPSFPVLKKQKTETIKISAPFADTVPRASGNSEANLVPGGAVVGRQKKVATAGNGVVVSSGPVFDNCTVVGPAAPVPH